MTFLKQIPEVNLSRFNYQILNMQGIEWESKPQTENNRAESKITFDENNISTIKNRLCADFWWSEFGRPDCLDLGD